MKLKSVIWFFFTVIALLVVLGLIFCIKNRRVEPDFSEVEEAYIRFHYNLSIGNFEKALRLHVLGEEGASAESLGSFKSSYESFGSVEYALTPNRVIDIEGNRAVLEFYMLGEHYIYYVVDLNRVGGVWKIAGRPELVTLEPL